MRVQHNIASMNSYRNYNNNTRSINKNLEKLSSGYRINRAGDDAAGLAISEKMRAQITGLEGAQKNAKDGISLVQTAEGALTEVHSMLNRMYSLAEQSANGTYDDSTDRAQLQKEVDALKTEINRIADSSNFNGTKLLDGSLSASGGSAAASVAKLDGNFTSITLHDADKWTSTVGATTPAIALSNVKALTQGQKITASVMYEVAGKAKSTEFSFTLDKDENGNDVLLGSSGTEYAIGTNALSGLTQTELDNVMVNEARRSGLESYFTITGSLLPATGTTTMTAVDAGVDGAHLTGVTFTQYNKDGSEVTSGKSAITKSKDGADAYYSAKVATAYNGTNERNSVITVNGKKYMIAVDGQDVTNVSSGIKVVFGQDADKARTNLASQISLDTGLNVTVDSADSTNLLFKAGTSTGARGGLTLQIGDTADSFNQMNVSISDMHAKAMGIGAVNIAEADSAATSMADIKDAIDYVSNVRGGLGAIQNRLEHTINNLSVMQENIQDAESTIRDTDVADEMMKYTKNSILVQSAQAMLAQANQQPQGVLQLLQ